MSGAVRAAFIGAGFMGQVHTRAARAAGAELAAVVGFTPEEGEQAAVRLGVQSASDSLEAVLADPTIDVVHILTPNFLHADQAAAVIAAGKHVVCEKPLATELVAARELAEQAARAGVVAAVPFGYRFHPMVREARARIAGTTIQTVAGRYLQDWLAGDTDDWRVDSRSGGRSRAFADIGSHLVDMIEFVTGERIVRVAARTKIARSTRGGRPVRTEDAVAVAIELSGGAIGTLLVSQVAAGHKNALAFEISTDEQTVAFEQERPETLWLGRTDGSILLPRDPQHLSADAARLSLVPAGHPMGYPDAVAGFLRDVYRSIEGATVEGLPTFADGLRAVQITDAVMHSAEDGAWVDVPAPSSLLAAGVR